MSKLTKEQAKEMGISLELADKLPESILDRLDVLKEITGQQVIVKQRRAKMEEAHGVYNSAKKALKEASDMLQEMIEDANTPSLFNRASNKPADDDFEKKETDGDSPKSPFVKNGKKLKKEKSAKPKRDGLQHPAVSAATGQKKSVI